MSQPANWQVNFVLHNQFVGGTEGWGVTGTKAVLL